LSYLTIRKWDEWQSYRKDRGRPPWIKLHRCLLRNPEWISLSDVHRAHLVSIWMLAADKDGRVPDDPKMIQRLCHLDKPPDLNLLIEHGFLDARLTPRRRQADANVTPQKQNRIEAEVEKKAEAEREFAGAFWPAYQHKTGKPTALASFIKKRQSHSLETILFGLRRYISAKPPDRQWLNPATFLNQERFLDEPAEVSNMVRLTKTELANRKIDEEMRDGRFGNPGICEERGEDAPAQLPKPSPRPGGTTEAAYHPMHRQAMLVASSDEPSG
jgi:hypothetical protein